jgi:hypothetical protein
MVVVLPTEMTSPRRTLNRTRSRELFARAQRSFVEGVHSPSRGAAVYADGPIMLERGQGSHVWNADGTSTLISAPSSMNDSGYVRAAHVLTSVCLTGHPHVVLILTKALGLPPSNLRIPNKS